MLRSLLYSVFSKRTWRLLKFDWLRMKARVSYLRRSRLSPAHTKLHCGCGDKLVQGWLNVDVVKSDFDVDLGCGSLPWQDNVFEVIVAQHVVEHLELTNELLPLLRELNRISKPNAEIWLTCPDMERICRSYLDSKGAELLQDRLTRFPDFSLHGAPSQHIVNDLFHQRGDHKNLFDYELLKWALDMSGFDDCKRMTEKDFCTRFPEFPIRNDDKYSLYVVARSGVHQE